jgi:teichuronopeptide biosynthesis TupA-like protein
LKQGAGMGGNFAERSGDASGAERLPPMFFKGVPPKKPHNPIRAALVPVAFKLRHLMSDATYLKTMHYLTLGSLPQLAAPQTFNELINYRKLYDRDPGLVITSDKFAVRDYVAERLGPEYLIRLIAHATDPLDIDFRRLPRSFALKLSAGSGLNIFVRNKAGVDWTDIVKKLQRWMRYSYYSSYREWAYKEIVPRILIEELLQDESGILPKDYKFHVFNGRLRLIQVHYDRFGTHRTNLYNEHFRPLNVEYQWKRATGYKEPPKLLRPLTAIAETLAAGFPYARIDLYEHRERIYFGEITHYPGAGLGLFDPPEFDRALGDLWLHDKPIPERYYAA